MILETSVHQNVLQIFKNSQDLAPALDMMNLLSKKLRRRRRRRRRRFMYKYCESSLISGTEICSESGSQSAHFEAADDPCSTSNSNSS
jgi:hypothetical protein